ncbi:HD domain-containing phosphohydrolase [Modicisalibacter coralii]|uniref:HD domain-containing phosphohydrolase n=1 Tax=Modicisalibacter coralii TaxID=2304602 RepID=UPI00100AC56A|nr:HD domain-containing phosphohydrolase [Halomonas coralii]
METLTDTPTQFVDHPREIAELLDALSQPGEVSLAFEEQASAPHSVLLVEIREDDCLVLDVTATPEIAGGLAAGRAFRISGRAQGAMVATPAMTATPVEGVPGRLRFQCPYPEQLDAWHRRHAFRAELKAGMHVPVEMDIDLASGQRTVHGELVNLSLGGCLLQMPMAEAVHLAQGQLLNRVEAIFPSGQRLASRGEVRHVKADDQWQRALVGFAFDEATPRLERLVWYLVKEIEREGARDVNDGKSLAPSPLFQAQADAPAAPTERASRPRYATPMARRLVKVADFLNAQVLLLKQGRSIDSALLSRSSDFLLGLLEQDREALLFATTCLHHEPVVVQHCIAVAVRLADLVSRREAPRELLKAVLAAGLVHDLGKVLLPDELLASPAFDADQHRRMASHVELIRERLRECRWLAPDVLKSVVGDINERLDGSGYPQGKRGDELATLSRAAAVIDAMDAMTRARPDRAAWTIEATYRHLLTHGAAYDGQWVQRVIRHFGVQPIGSLLAYSSGAVAWVHRLDERGQPALLHVVRNQYSLDKRIDRWAQGRDIDQLGRIEQLLDPSSEALTPS